MKKILITALAAGVVASSLGSAYAEGSNKGEVKAGVIKTAGAKEEANSKKKLVIGLIEGYNKEKGLVKIKPIFDLTGKVKGNGTAYINVKGAEFRDGKVTEYPEGYLISVYYDDLKKDGENIIVDADFVSAVEENAEVSINPIIEEDGEVGINPPKYEDGEVGINPPKEEKKGRLLVGIIEEYDMVNKKAKVKPLYNHGQNFSEGKAIIVNLNSADYEGKLDKSIKGKLISVYYKDMFERENSVIVNGGFISSIEENGEVGINPIKENDGEVGINPPKYEDGEVGINPPKERDEDKTIENELLIGKIKGYDSKSKMVKVEAIFDLTGKMDEKTVFIDLSNAKFPEDEVRAFSDGYLISVYYNELSVSEGKIIVKADILSSVEKDGKVSIQGEENVKEEANTFEVEVQENKKEDKGFFNAIADFFVNLFKF